MMVTGGIEDQLRGLALADPVGGASHHDVLAARFRREPIAPAAEGKTAGILSRRRGDPSLAAVGGDLDDPNAITAVPRRPRVATSIEARCLTQYVPVQPGTTRRTGYPFQCGSGAPFIS